MSTLTQTLALSLSLHTHTPTPTACHRYYTHTPVNEHNYSSTRPLSPHTHPLPLQVITYGATRLFACCSHTWMSTLTQTFTLSYTHNTHTHTHTHSRSSLMARLDSLRTTLTTATPIHCISRNLAENSLGELYAHADSLPLTRSRPPLLGVCVCMSVGVRLCVCVCVCV